MDPFKNILSLYKKKNIHIYNTKLLYIKFIDNKYNLYIGAKQLQTDGKRVRY